MRGTVQPSFNPFQLVFATKVVHCSLMRIIVLVILVGASCWAAGAFGTWKMNGARSTFTGGPQPKSLSIRIEPHAKGEVFTVDRIEADGRATSTSTILYLDSRPRPFQDFGCSGTQSSRRVDSETVENPRFPQGLLRPASVKVSACRTRHFHGRRKRSNS